MHNYIKTHPHKIWFLGYPPGWGGEHFLYTLTNTAPGFFKHTMYLRDNNRYGLHTDFWNGWLHGGKNSEIFTSVDQFLKNLPPDEYHTKEKIRVFETTDDIYFSRGHLLSPSLATVIPQSKFVFGVADNTAVNRRIKLNELIKVQFPVPSLDAVTEMFLFSGIENAKDMLEENKEWIAELIKHRCKCFVFNSLIYDNSCPEWRERLFGTMDLKSFSIDYLCSSELEATYTRNVLEALSDDYSLNYGLNFNKAAAISNIVLLTHGEMLSGKVVADKLDIDLDIKEYESRTHTWHRKNEKQINDFLLRNNLKLF